MATARQKKSADALDDAAPNTESRPWTEALRFEVYEENSGRHRWRLTTSDGQDLATSCASYASHDEARRAAGESRP
jgi:uncharacterized protein YegP (UPF0339 family)